jgi:hypothetical protein
VTADSGNGRTCRVCGDPRLDQIEADLARAGTNKRAVARKYGLGRMSVVRHARLHLPDRVRRAAEVAKRAPASQRTLEQVTELNKLARGLFTRAYNESNLSAAVSALAELRKTIEFEGRLLGTVRDPGARINIDVSVDREALARMAGAFLAVQQGEPVVLPVSAASIDAEVVSPPTEEDGGVDR